MSFSDILALIEILVTILFGYYITHWVTVRDTRTRSVKDLYLRQISDIKKTVDIFFNDLFSGKLKGRTIADWYGHQQNALTCFDEGLRLALPIRKRRLEDIVNDIHETITGSEFYNDNFNRKKYVLTKEEQANMLELKNRVDKSFSEYVVQINNSRQYYFWETILQNYRFDKVYFQEKNCSKPAWEALKIRIWKSIPYIGALVVFVFITRGTYNVYQRSISEERIRKENIDKIADKAFERIDTLNVEIQDISRRMVIGQKIDSCQVEQISEEIREISNRLKKWNK